MDRLRRERDAALAEVERLRGEVDRMITEVADSDVQAGLAVGLVRASRDHARFMAVGWKRLSKQLAKLADRDLGARLALARYVVTHYWSQPGRARLGGAGDPGGDHEGRWASYRYVLHDAADAAVHGGDALREAICESGAVDGDEIEITVHVTGRRPFGDRRVRLTMAHTYEREAPNDETRGGDQ